MSARSFSDMAPALRLVSTFEGVVKVLIDGSKFGSIKTPSDLSGCNPGTIKSLSLYVTRIGDPQITPLSNTLNGHQCTYLSDLPRSTEPTGYQIVSEVVVADKLPKDPARYSVAFHINWVADGAQKERIVADSFVHHGDMITPVITEITQGSTPGTSLKLKISPNNYEGLSPLITGGLDLSTNLTITGILQSVSFMVDGVWQAAEQTYAHDGVYEVTGLTFNKKHSFSVKMKSVEGYLSEISGLVFGTPIKTQKGPVAKSETGKKGDYSVSFPAFTRDALVGATVEEQLKDQMLSIDLFEYTFDADHLDAESAKVADHMYTKVRTFNKVILSEDGSSTFPATTFHFEEPEHGKFKRHHFRVTNGYGQGDKGTESTVRVLSDTVSKPNVSCSSLGGKKYQIAVQPGLAVKGYTLVAYKVSASLPGTFSELNSNVNMQNILATDASSNAIANFVYLDAIDRVTSSNILGKADIVSFQAASKVNFTANTTADFTVSAVGIYELTTQLKQLLPPGSVMLGADLRLAAAVWPTGKVWLPTGAAAPVDTAGRQTLVYGSEHKVFADAGFIPYVSGTASVSNSILVGDKVSLPAMSGLITPAIDISAATWTADPTTEFVSASGDNAVFKMSVTKFALTDLSDNDLNAKCSYETHTLKYSILKKNFFGDYEEIRSFYGSETDQAKATAQFDVPRGQKSEVGVQVSVYNLLNRIIAQSGITAATPLLASGKDAYSGLTVMSHGDQGKVAYPAANAVGADFKWVLNRAATGATATTCKVRIAFETSTRQDASFNNTHYPTKDAHITDPKFTDAGWVKDTKIYMLDKYGEEIKDKNVGAGTMDHKEFAQLGKPIRGFNVYTLDVSLNAMKSYSFMVHRDWKKGTEYLVDAAPITVTITPTIPVQPLRFEPTFTDGALNSAFELNASLPEENKEEQLRAIRALGGVFNAVLVQDKDDNTKYNQLEQSSSAYFTSAIENGTYVVASRAQYLSPNFGKDYSADTQYVMSVQTTDVPAKFAPGLAQLDATVVSTIDTTILTSASKHGCLFSWPELETDCTVEIRAVFNDLTYKNDDEYAVIEKGLKGTQHFITHAAIYGVDGSSNDTALHISPAEYYQGVTFLLIQKKVEKIYDTVVTTVSQPKALFHMPVGLTSFVGTDFDVITGSSKLTIKYNKIEDKDVYEDYAGRSTVPATIYYKVGDVIRELKVADITSANGIVISGLSDKLDYVLSIAIDGQNVDPTTFKPIAFSVGTFSPAAAPNPVFDLKVKPVVGDTTKLTVTFKVPTKNGEYDAATVTYKAYVYTLVDEVKKYIADLSGNISTSIIRSEAGFPITNNAVLLGLTSGSLYNVEIESIFKLTGHADHLVSAFASGVACAAPEIKDFRFDSKNSAARLVVNLNGAKLNTLLLLGNNGSVANIDLANAAVAQSKLGQIALNIAAPAGSTNVAVIVANSQGVALNAAQAAQGAAAVLNNATLYNAVTDWINL
jgi:hypothetical protein